MAQLQPDRQSQDTPIPLADHASHGFLWLMIPNLFSKASGFLGQLVLARLLAPRDFGLVALAYSIAAIPKLLRDNGLLQVLVGKQDKIDRWVSSVFWFDLILGALAALALAAAAPFCSSYFHQPPLTGLILLVAAGILINALSSVPMAQLYVKLEFRKIATAGLQYNLGVLILTVILAFMGFGPYSLLIPLPIFSAIRFVVLWRWASPRIHKRLGLNRWNALIKDAFPLALGVLLFAVQTAIPSIALGRMQSVAQAGIYYFGWNLSTQALQILSFNIMQVLLPVLSNLNHDLPRQAAALLRVLKMLVFVSAPACAVVAVLAGPAVISIFGPKWGESAEVLAILSIGTPFALLLNPLISYLQSRRRYTFSMYLTLAMLMVGVPMILIGSAWQGALLVAVAVTLQAVICVPPMIYLSIRDARGTIRDVLAVFVPFLPLSAMGILPIMLLNYWFPALPAHHLGDVFVGSVLEGVIYFGVSPWLCPGESSELWRRGVQLIRRITRTAA